MTEFAEELRHYCRYPRCRSKLPAPVANEREAFCTRGCHRGFYRRRCLICEQPMERKTEQQLICGKRKCRNALQARSGLGRYLPPLSGRAAQETPDFIDSKGAPRTDRGWRIIAGELTAAQFHAAVPDGPNCRWEGGSWRAIEAKNRAALEAHFDRLDAAAVARDFCAVGGGLDDLVDRAVTVCRACLVKPDAPAPAPIQDNGEIDVNSFAGGILRRANMRHCAN